MLYYNIVNFRKAVLPLEQELLPDADTESEKSLDEDTDMDAYMRKMRDLKNSLFKKAHKNIKDAKSARRQTMTKN